MFLMLVRYVSLHLPLPFPQPDPFHVRYCPYQATDEGVYIVKVFAAVEARFFWEISWQVTVEDTGATYRGDFATKMEFNFNATSSAFSLASIQNEVDLQVPCYACTRVATLNWKALQVRTLLYLTLLSVLIARVQFLLLI
jgi:hypothetical protein